MFVRKILSKSKSTFRPRNDGELQKWVSVFNEPRNNSMSALVICYCLPSLGSDQL